MTTIKSYTSVEQSCKLAEILPLESADMEYILEQWIDEETDCHKEEYCEIPVVKVNDDCPLQPITLPCWSLAALLSVLPTLDNKHAVFGTSIKGSKWHVVYHNIDTLFLEDSGLHSNLVDACYEMIIKLNEQKLL